MKGEFGDGATGVATRARINVFDFYLCPSVFICGSFLQVPDISDVSAKLRKPQIPGSAIRVHSRPFAVQDFCPAPMIEPA
jgi:hypothetical protein